MARISLGAPLEAGAGVLFGALSATRRARVFHPRGTAHTATVVVEAGDHPLAVLAGRHDAIVRLSRAAGTPEPLPDVLGLAVKLLNAHGAGGHQDFLLVTSGSGFPAHHLLVPTTEPRARPYSSLLPYRNARGTRFIVGALPTVGGNGRRFVLATADRSWRSVGTIDLGERLADDQAQRLRYNPWHTGGGLEPTGLLNRLRRTAYLGSQRGRPDTEDPPAAETAA
jgi:hypothetical protein